MGEHPAVEVHETHSAAVVLAGDRAYKAKKPVDLGFLDFATVERRADACRDEVRLNRRLARWRDAAALAATSARARLVVLECVASLDVAIERLHARRHEGVDPSEVTEDALRRLAAVHVPWPGALLVDTSGDDASTTVVVERCTHALV